MRQRCRGTLHNHILIRQQIFMHANVRIYKRPEFQTLYVNSMWYHRYIEPRIFYFFIFQKNTINLVNIIHTATYL